MNDFLKKYELYLETIAEANELNNPVVFDALDAAGLARVTIQFDGAGDSGQINNVTAYAAGNVRAEVPQTSLTLHRATQNESDRTVEVTLPNAIETLCYDYLSQSHDGWENNDGACGTFEFDVPNRTIHLDFNELFTDTIHHDHDF